LLSVPTVLSSELFWKRYFFRVHQVSQEEQRRKALLEGALFSQDYRWPTTESPLGTVDEEEFDWESDEEETTLPTSKEATSEKEVTETTKPKHDESIEAGAATGTKTSATSTPATSSPRRSESEDGSYDVVSSQVSNNGEVKDEEPKKDKEDTKTIKEEKEEDDDDSDWE
jgi:hypothetical protein